MIWETHEGFAVAAAHNIVGNALGGGEAVVDYVAETSVNPAASRPCWYSVKESAPAQPT